MYPISVIVRKAKVRWQVHVAHMGEIRSTYTVLVGTDDGKRSHHGGSSSVALREE
jgi:hypothetical protein